MMNKMMMMMKLMMMRMMMIVVVMMVVKMIVMRMMMMIRMLMMMVVVVKMIVISMMMPLYLCFQTGTLIVLFQMITQWFLVFLISDSQWSICQHEDRNITKYVSIEEKKRSRT